MKKVLQSLQEILGENLPFEELLQRKPDLENEVIVQRTLDMLRHVYETQMPFNVLLGVKVEHISPESVKTRISMKDELVGNYQQTILHGGVISSVLDLTGGIAVQAAAVISMKGCTVQEMVQRFSLMSTIDMRVDYLRPGRGETFTTRASAIRMGKKVGVARMEMTGSDDTLIAQGTGTYLVG